MSACIWLTALVSKTLASGKKSMGYTEGIETVIILLPNSALFNGPEDSMSKLYFDHNLRSVT